MVCGKLNICHDLVLDKNVNNNAYSTPLLHEALDVDHKMVMLGIGWYHNKFHIFVCNISIILNMILSVCSFYFTGYFYAFAIINDSMFPMLLRQMFLEFFGQTDIIVLVCKNALEYVNTSLPCLGALIPLSIITE